MPGFGSEPFGTYKFGLYNWPKRVVYDSLPERHQELDADEGHPQRTFLEAYQEELDVVRGKIRDLVHQRDPARAIASDTTYTIDIDSSSVVDDAFWGRCVLAVVSSGEDITSIGPGFIVMVVDSTDPTDIRTYKVLRVRTRNEPDERNEILLRGVPEALTNTEIEARSPSMLKHLGGDFSVIVDDEEPIQSQRSAVANIVALRSIKTNAQSYAVRGDMAGWEVEALGLWRLDSQATAFLLPADKVFELPFGSGKYYTTVDPWFLKFDEIAGDIWFLDPDQGAISMLDEHILLVDNSGDKMSPAMAFSENVLEGYFPGYAAEPTTITVTSTAAVPDPDPITGESLAVDPVFDGIETEFTTQLAKTLITPGSLTIDTSAGGGSEDFADNGLGVLVGDGGGRGTIDYDTGDITLRYNTAPAAGLTVSADYSWNALRFFSLPNIFRVTATMTPGQRAKIGTFTRGSFILVSTTTGTEYYIEDEESYSVGTSTIVFLTAEPTAPPAGTYKLKYYPSVTLSYGWCRSNVMVLLMEATQELIDGLGGNGERVNASYLRLRSKLERLIPAHVRLGAAARKLTVTVSGPTLAVSATVSDTTSIIIPMTAYYDYIAGDVIYTDTVGPRVSMTITTTP